MNSREPQPQLQVRSYEPGDRVAVLDAFRHLSAQSLYRRFFTLMPDPAPLVEPLLARVDHRDHEVLVVFDGDEVVAVAQWDRDAADAARAEVAVTVADAWQHRGVGGALMRMLAGDAHRHGVASLSANTLSENRPALELAARSHPARAVIDGTETNFTFLLAS